MSLIQIWIEVEDDDPFLYLLLDTDEETVQDLADYVARRYHMKTGERVTLKRDDIELDPDDKLRRFLMEYHGDEAIETVYIKASLG